MDFEKLRAVRGLRSRRGEQGKIRALTNLLLPLSPSHHATTKIDRETAGLCMLVGSIIVILLVLLNYMR